MAVLGLEGIPGRIGEEVLWQVGHLLKHTLLLGS